MKKRIMILAITFSLFLFITIMFMKASAVADDGKEYEKSLKEGGFYSTVVNYLRQVKQEGPAQAVSFNDFIILSVGDLIFSLFCLWLVVLVLIGKKFATVNSFGWFFLALNICWAVFLLLYRVFWNILDFLILRLRPDLGAAFSDSFSILIIIFSVFIYIWLLARSFHLNLSGALGTFFFSHLCYFLIIFFVFSFVNPGESRVFSLFKDNIGVNPIIRAYLSDVGKITSGQNFLSLLRIRLFHL